MKDLDGFPSAGVGEGLKPLLRGPKHTRTHGSGDFQKKKRGPMGDAGFFGGQVRLIRMEFLNEVSGPLSKMSNDMLVRSAKTTQSRVDTTWVLFCNLSFSLRRRQVFLQLCYEGSVHFQGLSNGPCVLG